MMRKYLYLILTALMVIIIVLVLPRKRNFSLTGEEILGQINLRAHIISVQKFKEMYAGEPGLQLVDLRGVMEFTDGHLQGALNLPAASLSTGDIHGFFEKKGQTRVIYAAETYQAEMYWILFAQMGVERLYVLETGSRLDSLIRYWDAERSRMIMVDEIPAFRFQPDTTLTF